MPLIYIDCPTTEKPVSTGMDLPDVPGVSVDDCSVTCPHCGDEHTWSLVAGQPVVHKPR